MNVDSDLHLARLNSELHWKNGIGHVTELDIIIGRIEIIRNSWNTNELLAFEELHNIEWHAAIKLPLLCDNRHLSCGSGTHIYMCWHCWDSIWAFATTNKSRISLYPPISQPLPTCIYRKSNPISSRSVWTDHTWWLPDFSSFSWPSSWSSCAWLAAAPSEEEITHRTKRRWGALATRNPASRTVQPVQTGLVMKSFAGSRVRMTMRKVVGLGTWLGNH